MPRALYLSQTGMSEPLGQSQVVPYVKGLREAGWQMEIVAFEPARALRSEIERTERQLRESGVAYSWTRRSASHSPLVKAYEAGRALLRAIGRTAHTAPEIVHARSYFAAAIARAVVLLSRRTRFLFDVRGPMGEEFVDAGHWSAESLSYRLLKRTERELFARADAIVVLTDRHRRWLRGSGLVPPRTPIRVIPCCVEVSRFEAGAAHRAAARAVLQAGDRFVVTYAGTLGGCYPEGALARFFAAVRRRKPSLFAVYTHSNPERLRRALADVGVPAADVLVRRVSPPEMPRYLSAADAGVHFMTQGFSRIGCSPTKVPEYLASGLPVVMNRGIGDSDEIIATVPAVVDAGTLAEGDLEHAAARLVTLDRSAVEAPARQAARARFSTQDVGVPRYLDLYHTMLETPARLPGKPVV